jgi:hypothetical protein
VAPSRKLSNNPLSWYLFPVPSVMKNGTTTKKEAIGTANVLKVSNKVPLTLKLVQKN